MRVLITGGCGFIGSNFIKLLFHTFSGDCNLGDSLLERFPRSSSEAELQVMNIDSLTYAGNLENVAGVEGFSGYEFSKTDIRDTSGISEIFEKFRPGYVVHFAAESHVDRSIDSGNIFVETNVLGTQVLLECAREFGVKKFLHVSTDEVYGSLMPSDPPFLETTPLNPKNPYSATKAASDMMVQAFVNTHGISAVITRCSNNYGPNQFPEKLIPLMTLNALAGDSLPVYGDGLQIRDWIHVEDHCNGIIDTMYGLKSGILSPGEVINFGANNE